MIKRILVGLGGTAYTPVAIRQAVSLAQSSGAEVTGAAVLDVRRVRNLGRAVLQTRDEMDAIGNARTAITEDRIAQSIRDFEAACQAADVKHRVVEETGDAFTKLIELARYHDVMVFGLRSIFEYDFLCPDPQALLMRLVGAGVRPLIAVAQEFRPINRVLIGSDKVGHWQGYTDVIRSYDKLLRRLSPETAALVAGGNVLRLLGED